MIKIGTFFIPHFQSIHTRVSNIQVFIKRASGKNIKGRISALVNCYKRYDTNSSMRRSKMF